jgi:hypothetical protein
VPDASTGASFGAMNRRRFLRQASASFLAALSTRCSSQAPTFGDRRTRIEQLMAQLHQQNEFTGEILVAEKGQVIYAGAFGLADRSTGQRYTTDTRSCLASLSKPITASAIMMLADQSPMVTRSACGTKETRPAFAPSSNGASSTASQSSC